VLHSHATVRQLALQHGCLALQIEW
jgi:hypothetical protein